LASIRVGPIEVPNTEVTLAAVTRRDHDYQWTVREVIEG
jgi:hypothetical protein